MTATLVAPAGSVARADPRERLRDYIAALQFYLSLPDAVVDRIVLVDNSAADVHPLIEAVRDTPNTKTVELISFDGNNFPVHLGKAYGEFRLLQFGMAHSTVIRADDVVWKTTGRLWIRNLPALKARAGSDWDMLCDLHNVPFVGTRSLGSRCRMDLRCFAFRPSAFDAVFRVQDWAPDRPFDSSHAYHAVIAARKSLRVRPRFPLQPEIAGVSGRHLHRYDQGPQLVKARIRGALRWVAPWLWL